MDYDDYDGDLEGGLETIQIQVSGARTLLSESFTGLATRGQTWIGFLRSCGVEIKARADQMFVRTWQTDKVQLPSGDGYWGWTAEMDERIDTFIAKYPKEMTRTSYSVMLCWKPEAAPPAKRRSSQGIRIYKGNSNAGGPPSMQILVESPSAPILVECPAPPPSIPSAVGVEPQPCSSKGSMGPPPPPGRRSIFKRPLAPSPTMMLASKRVYPYSRGVGGATSAAFYQRRSGGAVDPLGVGARAGNDRVKEEDIMSLCTSVGAEEMELAREGIAPENLKPQVKEGLRRFSETFLDNMKKEIERLKQNNLWDRNFGRAPLSTWFLGEIFKE